MAGSDPSGNTGRHPSIGDLIRDQGPTFSFEFGPPKTPEAETQLWRAIRDLERLRPTFVSVTYGAGGGTRDLTVAVVERIAADTTLLPMAHLTAVNHSVAELRQVIGRFAAVGIRNLMLIRGDPPGDPLGEWVAHPEGLRYAEDLVRLAKEIGDFSVGVAAFPYKHPRSPDLATDTAYFIDKCRAGADFAVTQMFFDVEDYLRLRDRVVAAGGDTPIVAGLMPVLSMRTIEVAEQLSGAPFPPTLGAEFDRIASDPAAVRAKGIEHASQMCRRLLDEGVPGIHFYTFNRSTATREVWQNLGDAVPA